MLYMQEYRAEELEKGGMGSLMVADKMMQSKLIIKQYIRSLRFVANCRWDDIDAAFIISTGRTGTKFLAEFLSSAFRKVDARHEPRPDLFDIGTAYIRSQIPFREALASLRTARQQICRDLHSNGIQFYIEANNNLAYLIPVLRAHFKDCKVIHIVRDGRDFVRSSYSKTVTPVANNGKTALFMTPEDRRRRLQAIDLPHDPYRKRWSSITRFERLCWYWVKKDSLILDSIEGDSRAITVKFEDVFDGASGFPGMREIIEFLGLEANLSITQDDFMDLMKLKSNKTKRHLLPKWEDWSNEQIEQFTTIAGSHMQRHNYELHP